MAQIQTALYPLNGPSWDDEVVPALRKRLESESRTLAKRLSAVSLVAQDEHFISMHTDLTTKSTYTSTRDTSSPPFLQSNASSTRQRQISRAMDRIPPEPNGTSVTSISNSSSPSPTPGSASSYQRQRSRTYSQPYIRNGHTPRPKVKGSPHGNGKQSRSPDVRPTRIPKPTSRSTSHAGSPNAGRVTPSPIPNGYHQNTISTPNTPSKTTKSSPAVTENGRRTPIPIRASSSLNVNTSVGLGLMNEPPPFNPASASSSKTPSQRSASPDPAPPRPSVESEERPFEHWYRGEVSRNGGVGELRVGRRQEMLEIANYGHTIRARERERRAKRRRADSVTGIGDGSRERTSLYLDDEDARRVGRVLDEAPLTDLDGSEGGHHDDEIYGYGGRDIEDYEEQAWKQPDEIPATFDDEGTSGTTLNGHASFAPDTSQLSHDTRSTTPTPAAIQTKRPDSRNAGAPPSKIPARSRQSSESRVTTPTPMIRGSSESPSPTPQTPQSRQPQSKPTPNKRAPSKPRTPAAKARSKTVPSKKNLDDEAERRSVAHYPTPGNDGDETMIDAIPEWTQPVPRQGNWDEVVLPVVARKKGLDEHYERAAGNTMPRIAESTPAPAPGTFGYDGSKYRPPRVSEEPESIPMDDFGQVNPDEPEQDSEPEKPTLPSIQKVTNRPEQTRLPNRITPSPAPFSDYAPGAPRTMNILDVEQQPTTVTHHRPQPREDEAGCCKCIIM